MKLKKRLRLKNNIRLSLYQVVALIGLFTCYYLSTIIKDLVICSILWLAIVFIIPSIIFMIQLIKEYKHER